ncbi:gamma-aminobutyric acid receptor subunit beta-like protein [Leptotrombidium deliense]|uniref:Gamma-aminobutyric acid receptor subunit beta-like protein n=1 Tax=Leptotrombidium deliense TaxID=299467 RepID=A0A443SBH4_9ACAR|nr:gamma-aminobutyric acid receptor subunit beta-like protein [Leptotrombidium deliense]
MITQTNEIWKDERLSFTTSTDIESIKGSSDIAMNIWLPHLFFPKHNVLNKGGHANSNTNDNVFVEIYDNGNVTLDQIYSTSASCEIEFGFFPMDRHICKLEIQSLT